jgi:hypothetical protein
MHAGTANATKWVVHLQGGGWCSDSAGCAGRTKKYLGTSLTSVTHYTNVTEFADCKCDNKGCGALMLNDPTVNEFTHDWNAVFVRCTLLHHWPARRSPACPAANSTCMACGTGTRTHHGADTPHCAHPTDCDGMSFAGNMSDPLTTPTGQKLWFRGLEILRATFDSLASTAALGDATDVILNGASAGGLATYLHADRMAGYVRAANAAASHPPARIVALPDSGFWPDDPLKRFAGIFRGWFALQGNVTDGLPVRCKWARSNVTRCLFPQYWADEIETRLFPLQSLYDPLQNFVNNSSPDAHGDWLLDKLNQTVLQTRRPDGTRNGGYIYSCARHCGGELLSVNGFTAVTALETLLGGGQSLFLDHAPFPCKSCCNDSPYPPALTL